MSRSKVKPIIHMLGNGALEFYKHLYLHLSPFILFKNIGLSRIMQTLSFTNNRGKIKSC